MVTIKLSNQKAWELTHKLRYKTNPIWVYLNKRLWKALKESMVTK